MAEFRIPNKIIYGEGAAKQLGDINGERLLLVYDNPLIKDITLSMLRPSGISVRPFQADPSHTEITLIKEGTKAMMEFKPDWVLAAGGHSSIDLAKLIRIFYQRPELTFEDAAHGKVSDIVLNNTRLIVLPSYNTNGGEASCSAYISDTNGDLQAEIRNPHLVPDIAIIDPDIPLGYDDEHQSQCILSTFIHAIEAAGSPQSSSFVRPFALEALSILSRNVLPHSAAPTSAAPLLYAQCLAGIAHTNSVPGLCSALCRAAAHAFGISSLGSLGAAILPAIIRMDKNPDRYIDAANAMGLNDAAALSNAIQEYADMLGLPLSLREMGIGKNTFLKKLSKISHTVLTNLSFPSGSGSEAQKHIEQILRAAYSSKE